jgi:hypothetical protein
VANDCSTKSWRKTPKGEEGAGVEIGIALILLLLTPDSHRMHNMPQTAREIEISLPENFNYYNICSV